MNILWLAPHPIPIEKNMHPAPWIISLATSLIASGHTVTILAVSKKVDSPVVEYTNFPYKFIVVKAPSFYNDVFTLFSGRINALSLYLKKNEKKYDLIHIHGTEHQLGTSYLKSSITTPAIISIQGLIFEYKKYMREFISIPRFFWEVSSYYEKKEIKKATYFFVRTHWDSFAVNNLNNHAVTFKVWELLRREFYDYKHQVGGNDIFFMGGTSSLKGFDFAIRVFDRLLSLDKSCKMHIVGKSSDKLIETYKKRYRLKNIHSNNLYIHGSLTAENITEIYKNCYCLYHPSLIDNSPNSVCEAQLVGLPVVANNVGGVSSLITQNETGLLVTPNQLEEHINTLLKLKIDTDLQLKISNESRNLASKRHNPETIVKATIAAYTQILSRNVDKSSIQSN